jgi:hypothetical protein
MDPITPPKYGRQTFAVIIPEAGHGPQGFSNPGCIDRIAIEFLHKGDAKNVDVSCVDQMAGPPSATN